MLKLLPGYLIVLCLLLFCSCTKKVYTHQQVMQGFHTKDDVLKQFGNPDQVKEGADIEEWTYNRDKVSEPNKTNKPDTIIATDAVSDTLKASQPVAYSKYIRFIFDREGNVAGYKTQGIDMSRTTQDSFGIGLLKVLGITALVVIIVGLDVYNNTDINL
jgi:hypothetical protein